MDNTQSYYEILKISPKTSDEEVKRAYHSLAKKFHPDRNQKNRRLAERNFRMINEAYAELKTREKRIAYNRLLRLQAQNDNTSQGFFSQIGEIFWPSQRKERKEQT